MTWPSVSRRPVLVLLYWVFWKVVLVRQKSLSGKLQLLMDVLIIVNRRIPVSDIPQDTDGCNEWVHQLYREKDEIYDYFVKHDTFEGRGPPRVELPRNTSDLFIELGWMALIGIPSFFYVLKFLWTSSFLAQIIFASVIFLGEWALLFFVGDWYEVDGFLSQLRLVCKRW